MMILGHLVLVVLQHPQLLQCDMKKRSHSIRALYKLSTGWLDSYHVDLIEYHLQGSDCHLTTSLLEDLGALSSLAHI